MRILISGTTGDSMPPPYAGVQNVSLLYAGAWGKMGHEVGITFVYKPENADDIGAGAEYFFEYKGKPNKFKKIIFLKWYSLKNPILYFSLLKKYLKIYPKFSAEVILYPAYGVFIDGVIKKFKPDIIVSEAALIKTFMVSEVAKKHSVPVVFDTYAEVHDQNMGVNKKLDKSEQKKYWTYLLGLSELVIGMDNCSLGPLSYLPRNKVKIFYDTTDYNSYQVTLKESREELRDSFKLPHDIFFVGMMGAFHYRKGHDQLIKAVSILKKKGIRSGATIVGGNAGIEEWQRLIKEEGVEDRVFLFQNFGEEKKIRLYKCIDAYANLSNSTRSCGLDLALLEAMSCSLPLVVYDNGALPNAVNGHNGYMVKTSDVNAVADAIEKLSMKSRGELQKMGEESSKIASKTDINITSRIKLDWFKEVIANYKSK